MQLKRARVFLVTAVVVLIAAMVVLGGSWLNGAAVAQQGAPAADTVRTINVSGTGQIEASPDVAVVSLGVQAEADTASDAITEVSEQIQNVISATVDAGVAEEDIQTQVLQLQPVYQQPQPQGQEEPGQPELTGYRASNILRIRTSDLDNLGSLLDTVVDAGVNTIDSINFQVSNPEEVASQAREQAVQDAIDKAQQLTNLTETELGPVMSITELDTGGPVPRFSAVQESAADVSAVPISPGTVTIESRVNITWQLGGSDS